MLAWRGGACAAQATSVLAAALGAVMGCSFPAYAVTTSDDATLPSDDADAPSIGDADALDGPSDGDARDATIDADATALDGDAGGDGDGGGGCPVTQLNFAFPSAVKLNCTSSVVLDVTLPVGTEGLAFARANLTLKHATVPSISYHWSAKLEVGAPDADQVAFSSGDNLCPGVTAGKIIGGYGRVDATNAHVRLTGLQAATLCSPGTITVDATSSIDVWVESPRPECMGKSIVVASYLKLVGPTGAAWDWPLSTAAAPILTAKIETAATDTSLVAMAMIQGTAATNPNTSCGSEVGALTIKTTLDGTALSTAKLPMPATPSGAGHLMLDTFHQAPTTAGVHTVQLLAGRDFVTSKVSTGGAGGDAMLALVRK